MTRITLYFSFVAIMAIVWGCNKFDPKKNYLIQDNVKSWNIAASSVLENKPDKYGPKMLVDMDTATWCEGKKDEGVGETLTYTFKDQAALSGGKKGFVTSVMIQNGYGEAKYWPMNARVKELVMQVGKYKKVITLADKREPQIIQFAEPVIVSDQPVKFTIQSVYPGSKFKDTCISELAFNVSDAKKYFDAKKEAVKKNWEVAEKKKVNFCDGVGLGPIELTVEYKSGFKFTCYTGNPMSDEAKNDFTYQCQAQNYGFSCKMISYKKCTMVADGGTGGYSGMNCIPQSMQRIPYPIANSVKLYVNGDSLKAKTPIAMDRP